MVRMKCGLYCDIIDQNSKGIKVLFEDGTVVNSTMAQFAMHNIERPVYPYEQKVTKSGRICYLERFHNYSCVDVVFPNGDYLYKVNFRDFVMNNIDDSQVISYMQTKATPNHFITYIILDYFINNVQYNTNNFDIYLPTMNIGINIELFYKYIHNKKRDYSGASKVFTIAERSSKIQQSPKNTTLRLSSNLSELTDRRSIYSYFYDLEQILKELAVYLGIDSSYVQVTAEMIQAVCGNKNNKWNYTCYLAVDIFNKYFKNKK